MIRSKSSSSSSSSTSSLSFFRSYDAFATPMDGLRSKTILGGIITLLAMTVAIVLFICQCMIYLQVDTHQSIRLTRSYPVSMILPSSLNTATTWKHKKNKKKEEDEDTIHHVTPSKYEGSISKPRPDHISHLIGVMDEKEIQKNYLDITFRITFPYIPCEDLQFTQDGQVIPTSSSASASANVASHSRRNSNHWRKGFHTRVPTMNEYLIAKYGPTKTTTLSSSFSKQEEEDKAFSSSTSTTSTLSGSCTVEGSFHTLRIGGDMSISLTSVAWTKVINQIKNQIQFNPTMTWNSVGLLYNMTHYIHEFNFGPYYYDSHDKKKKNKQEQEQSNTHPFLHKLETIHHPSGIAVVYHNIKIIPTTTTSSSSSLSKKKNMVQLSTASHIVQPETLESTNVQMFPGIVFHYDISPLEIVLVSTKEKEKYSFLIFITSLMSIVSGTYILVGWISSCIVQSAITAVGGKKRD